MKTAEAAFSSLDENCLKDNTNEERKGSNNSFKGRDGMHQQKNSNSKGTDVRKDTREQNWY